MQVRLGPPDLADGELRSVAVGRTQHIVVVRLGDRFHALDDVCNHAGCHLSGGWMEGVQLVCPCHEYAFDVRTGCRSPDFAACDDQRTFHVSVVDGQLVTELPEVGR
jgi:3-phenylpropionate/trans-cinnamate dioxygenase ferredoxin subunit